MHFYIPVDPRILTGYSYCIALAFLFCNPERTNIIVRLLQNNYISQQIKNNTELKHIHILLPESVNEVSPAALMAFLDKIRDALYLLSETKNYYM
jgi:hypothetical protein